MNKLKRRIRGRTKACKHCGHKLYRGFGPKCPHCAADPRVVHDPSDTDLCGCRKAHPKSNEEKRREAEARRQKQKDEMADQEKETQ